MKWAAEQGFYSICVLFIEYCKKEKFPVDPTCKSLIVAKTVEIAELLIENGVNMNLDIEDDLFDPNTTFTNVVDRTISQGNLTIAKYLLQKGAVSKRPPLELAVFFGEESKVQSLVNSENVNQLIYKVFFFLGLIVHKNNSTLLHVAARFGHVKIIRILLDFGVDKRARDSDGHVSISFIF